MILLLLQGFAIKDVLVVSPLLSVFAASGFTLDK